MKTGKTLHGSIDLVFDAVAGTTRMVEDMHRNIAATPWPLGEAPEGSTRGITGAVYGSIKKVTELTRSATGTVLSGISPLLDRTLLPGPHREAVISALNGVWGDHLARSGNQLAIPMQLRVMLPPSASVEETPGEENFVDEPATAREQPFASLFESEKRSVEVHPRPDALGEEEFRPGRRILLLVHGLCMNDREWTSEQHNHGEALADSHGYSPVYALYNSGLNVSTNGRELCQHITGLLETWPEPVDSITLIGFSMGGLIARSAMHIAESEEHAWLDKVDKSVYVGTPHHGAVLERGGFWLQKSLTVSPYTAPLATPGRIRSSGITDLRHGNICDDDWRHHDKHEDHTDHRRPIPLPAGIHHYAIAATLSKRPGEFKGKLLGDGLVHPASATGRHDNELFKLAFPEGHTRILYGLGHLAMLSDMRVLQQLEEWLDHKRD